MQLKKYNQTDTETDRERQMNAQRQIDKDTLTYCTSRQRHRQTDIL